jgi:hypothetical protein
LRIKWENLHGFIDNKRINTLKYIFLFSKRVSESFDGGTTTF